MWKFARQFVATFVATLAAILCLFLAGAAGAEPPSPDLTPQQQAELERLIKLEQGFKYQTGVIQLPQGVASLQLAPGFRYLGPEDTRKLVEQGWGNPDGAGTWGMILPADVHPLSGQGWGVIITYEADGHVADDDAAEIDYADLLKEMQEATTEENKERTAQGFDAIALVGWAQPPRYDQGAHTLHWAKELRFGDAQEHTLNYNIRVLGREGVLVLNAVAGMSQFQDIRPQLDQVVGAARFVSGQRYEDFDASSDKLAGYGLAALVAGSVAAKAGKLAFLAVFFKKFLGLILVGVALVGGWLAKRFKRKPA